MLNSEVPCVRYLIGRIVKTYDYINRVVLTLLLSVYEGTWTHSPLLVAITTKKDTSVTFWAERIFFCHTYDTSMTIIVTKPGIIIDVVGSYFYDKKS